MAFIADPPSGFSCKDYAVSPSTLQVQHMATDLRHTQRAIGGCPDHHNVGYGSIIRLDFVKDQVLPSTWRRVYGAPPFRSGEVAA